MKKNLEIINKIDASGLITIDISDFKLKATRKTIDLSDWLDEGLIIREASFKEQLKNHRWADYSDCYVSIICSKDVIIPPWTYPLIQMKLRNIAKQVFFTNLETMDLLLFQQQLNIINFEKYKNKRVFLKVCNNESVPLGCLSLCIDAFAPHVKSLFYGEPCSSIPLIKN